MGIKEIIAIVVIALIICFAIIYIVKAKKSGKKCIGCPYGNTCKKKGNKTQETDSNGCCSCNK